jgi:hypothetical protein
MLPRGLQAQKYRNKIGSTVRARRRCSISSLPTRAALREYLRLFCIDRFADEQDRHDAKSDGEAEDLEQSGLTILRAPYRIYSETSRHDTHRLRIRKIQMHYK